SASPSLKRPSSTPSPAAPPMATSPTTTCPSTPTSAPSTSPASTSRTQNSTRLAPAGLARSASPACQLPSPTLSTTPPAFASAATPSRPTNSSEPDSHGTQNYNRPMQFSWLPVREDFDESLREVKTLAAADTSRRLRELATTRLDLTQTAKLDRAFLNALKFHTTLPGLEPLRLAILGSATTSHLPAGIRVAGLRRGLAVEIYEAPYGMYWQELNSPDSALHNYHPHAILLALDARHLSCTKADSGIEPLASCWREAKSTFHC